ncbi:hypothetical protein [Mesorhizobium sp. M0060]|uniref:hypothetical protein n=1 Tax=Mesorhizobium sp. M0060 TaxID=2956866 RepID=UPI003337B7B8
MIDPEIKARYPDFHLISIVVRNAEIDVPDAQALNDTIAAAEQAALRESSGDGPNCASSVE